MEWFSSLSLAYKLLVFSWLFVLIWVPYVIYSNKKHHPSALFVLFFAELWERFSYYGMRALLVLYMIDKGAELLYDKSHAYAIYGAYGAMVYATPLLGGLIAEKFFGYRKAILWGGILMAMGHFTMAFPILNSFGFVSPEFFESLTEPFFFIALGLLILGNGFFKPNISSFVGTFYEEGSTKRDRGFNLFYMGINVGAFLAPITCGAIGQDHVNFGVNSWHYGFGLAGIGMVLGLLVFSYGLRKGVFKDNGYSPNKELLNSKPFQSKIFTIFNSITVKHLTYIGTFACIPLIFFLLNVGAKPLFHPFGKELSFLDIILFCMVVFMIFYLYNHGKSITKEALDKIKVILFLFFYSTLFWAFFELAGSAITVYTETNVDRTIPWLDSTPLSSSQFMGVNPLYIILLVPLFNVFWKYLKNNNMEPSAPMKFAIGTILLGLGFFAFPLGGLFANNGMVPLIFLLVAYLLHTLGELCLSPVGLSLVTKLAPKQIVGFVMGFWFLSSSLAHLLGKFIAQETDGGDLSPVDALEKFNGVFSGVGIAAVIAGLILVFLSPKIKSWMHGIN
jgi:POT family proton-dependent oligopeptide transporter|tara:strand:+ start:92 stop:1777 length:1686 start_codon:yes stop_codon:yes gene_type:complete